MGLIREPKGVDFMVIDKPFTLAEKKEFSMIIEAEKKKRKRVLKRKRVTNKHKGNS